MANSALYAYIDSDELDRAIAEFRSLAVCADRLDRMAEPTHITIVYGPESGPEKPETPTLEWARETYPIPEIAVRGIAVEVVGINMFRRPHRARFIVKIQVRCPQLNAMRAAMLDLYPAIRAQMDAEAHLVKASGVLDDDSFGVSADEWAHVTLAIFDDEAKAMLALAAARATITLPRMLAVKNITALTPISDTPVILFS
jgi:hypothetical protein